MKLPSMFALALLIVAGPGLTPAAELAGKWTAEFDTQIGIQKYVYEFRFSGDRYIGKATFERTTGKGEADLKEIKLSGEDVSFVEPLVIEGNEIPITYSGKMAGDEMKLTRNVGDFATEQIVVRRAKALEPKPGAAK